MTRKGDVSWNKGVHMWATRPHPRGMAGKHHTIESMKKMSIAHIGICPSEETRKKMSETQKQRPPTSEETHQKISVSKIGKNNPIYGKHRSEETRKKMSEAHKDQVPWCKGLTKETDKRIVIQAKQMLKRWQDPVYREKNVRATAKAQHRRPNHPETIVLELIQRYNLPFVYTGSGDLVIDGFNPDFKNNNGGNKLIEVFGDFWHNKPKVIERDNRRLIAYKKHDYQTLVIWEHELENLDKVIMNIKTFAETI